jgi:hypothetical protein
VLSFSHCKSRFPSPTLLSTHFRGLDAFCWKLWRGSVSTKQVLAPLRRCAVCSTPGRDSLPDRDTFQPLQSCRHIPEMSIPKAKAEPKASIVCAGALGSRTILRRCGRIRTAQAPTGDHWNDRPLCTTCGNAARADTAMTVRHLDTYACALYKYIRPYGSVVALVVFSG